MISWYSCRYELHPHDGAHHCLHGHRALVMWHWFRIFQQTAALVSLTCLLGKSTPLTPVWCALSGESLFFKWINHENEWHNHCLYFHPVYWSLNLVHFRRFLSIMFTKSSTFISWSLDMWRGDRWCSSAHPSVRMNSDTALWSSWFFMRSHASSHLTLYK